jgi:hypothetical protein
VAELNLDEEPGSEPSLGAGCIAGIAVLVIATALAAIYWGTWLIAESIWWLVERGGWPRASVGLAVAAAGCAYVYRTHRRTP